MRMTPSALSSMFVFFFNDTATTAIYTLSLHDALPIYAVAQFAERHEQMLERNVEPLAPDIVLGERIGEPQDRGVALLAIESSREPAKQLLRPAARGDEGVEHAAGEQVAARRGHQILARP